VIAKGDKIKMLKLSGKHILLLLLYSPGNSGHPNEPLVGRTRIIKMLFLFDKEIKRQFLKDSHVELISFPEFYAWHYGPFAKDVYDDIEFFINNGFIENRFLDSEKSEIEMEEYENWFKEFLFDDETELLSNSRNDEQFQLTSKGIKFVEDKINNQLTENQKEIIIKFKENINSATLPAIMRYVYMKYPDYTGKSKVKEKYCDQ
jgi:hypothetical protein